MIEGIKVIGFDADDTLWVNEPNYKEIEKRFCALLKGYCGDDDLFGELFKTEMNNLELYGYGAKGFMLSMIETALRLTSPGVPSNVIEEILAMGKELLNKPIELIDGVQAVLEKLEPRFRLIIATKGDLLDQERKLRKSGLTHYFHHIEIMSDKNEQSYLSLLAHLDIEPHQFAMIGNSLKSDVLPVLNLGGWGIFVPYHTIWLHEHVDEDPVASEKFRRVEKISDLMGLL